MKLINTRMIRALACSVVLLLAVPMSQVQAQWRSGYKVVANPSISVSSLTRDELSRVFLKKT